MYALKPLTLADHAALEQFVAEAPLRIAWLTGQPITPEIRSEVSERSIFRCRNELARLDNLAFLFFLRARPGVTWEAVQAINFGEKEARELVEIARASGVLSEAPPTTGAISSAAP